MGLGTRIIAHAVGEAVRATAQGESEARKQDPIWWWYTRGAFVLVLVVGWVFILWQNRFHVDAPSVVMCLGFLAVMLAVANLWRVGASAVAPEHAGTEAWERPMGERAELEKEKKTLLRSIKEAEFDQAMGKLSKRDADDLIAMYRARAIVLIKELDQLDAGAAGTTREQIEREVAARLAVEQDKAKAGKKGAQKAAKAEKAKADARKPSEKKAGDAKADAAKADDAKADAAEADAAEADAAEADAAEADAAEAGAAKADDAKTLGDSESAAASATESASGKSQEASS